MSNLDITGPACRESSCFDNQEHVISDIIVLIWLHGNGHTQFKLQLCLLQYLIYLGKYGTIANRIVNYAYPCRGICIINTITKLGCNIGTDLIVKASTIPIKFYHLSMLIKSSAANWRFMHMINSISLGTNRCLRFSNTSLWLMAWAIPCLNYSETSYAK